MVGEDGGVGVVDQRGGEEGGGSVGGVVGGVEEVERVGCEE